MIIIQVMFVILLSSLRPQIKDNYRIPQILVSDSKGMREVHIARPLSIASVHNAVLIKQPPQPTKKERAKSVT